MTSERDLPRILVVEDDDRDMDLFREAMDRAGFDATLHRVRDGVDCLQTLHADEDLPDLILLDLNMPRMSGLEVIAALKADPALCDIPVVVLTTSDRREDKDQAVALDADAYIVKSHDFGAFADSLRLLHAFLEPARRAGGARG